MIGPWILQFAGGQPLFAKPFMAIRWFLKSVRLMARELN